MIVATARDAAELMRPHFADAVGEKVVVLHLDRDRRPIATDTHGGGDEDEAPLPLRRIVEEALRHGSRSLVLAHNHPSGAPEPSRADLEATRRLADTAGSLGIALLDHLVFAGGEVRSFREMGLL